MLVLNQCSTLTVNFCNIDKLSESRSVTRNANRFIRQRQRLISLFSAKVKQNFQRTVETDSKISFGQRRPKLGPDKLCNDLLNQLDVAFACLICNRLYACTRQTVKFGYNLVYLRRHGATRHNTLHGTNYLCLFPFPFPSPGRSSTQTSPMSAGCFPRARRKDRFERASESRLSRHV